MSDWLDDLPARIGQVHVSRENDGRVVLRHFEDVDREDLLGYEAAEAAREIARFDEAGNFRPLKTAPNLRRGWQLHLRDLKEAHVALDYFYPGRAAVYGAWHAGNLQATPLRETLNRQSGMYRVAAKISDEDAEKVIANFCRSDVGCLRTILWTRAVSGLPPAKFDPRSEAQPLICQEACNLLVGQLRQAVKESPNE